MNRLKREIEAIIGQRFTETYNYAGLWDRTFLRNGIQGEKNETDCLITCDIFSHHISLEITAIDYDKYLPKERAFIEGGKWDRSITWRVRSYNWWVLVSLRQFESSLPWIILDAIIQKEWKKYDNIGEGVILIIDARNLTLTTIEDLSIILSSLHVQSSFLEIWIMHNHMLSTNPRDFHKKHTLIQHPKFHTKFFKDLVEYFLQLRI